jgi:hypothetical protein
MRAFARKLALIASASLVGGVMPGMALADTTGIYLPAPPTSPGGEDAIETSSGTRCRQSINSNGAMSIWG